MAVNWRHLPDGTWGIQGENLEPGQTVVVTRRDGSSQKVRVLKILSTTNGVDVATIERKQSYRECSCRSSCCRHRCRCDANCNCRGGNIYDC